MPHQAPNPNNYGRALHSAPPQAIAPSPHSSAPPQVIAPSPHTNLLNVYMQLANKMVFQQQKKIIISLIVFSVRT
jgi:hypothetical protein